MDPERVQRGSIYHDDECRRLAKIEARRETAKKKCRLCGRGFLRCCPELQKELKHVRRAHRCKYAKVTPTKTKGAAA